jgi:hypothetical protein
MANQQKDDAHGYDRKSTTDNQHKACIVACNALPRLCDGLDYRTLFRHANLSSGGSGRSNVNAPATRRFPAQGATNFRANVCF